MVAQNYVPDRGDLIWLDFNPQAGHEQAGHRPAIVLSPASYNGKTGLMLCCPITNQVKGYPFEVNVQNTKIKGAALCDQVKSLDWRIRSAKKVARAKPLVVADVLTKARALLM